MIDPESYVTIEPMDCKISDKARKFRSQRYVQIRDIIKEDVDQEEVQLDLVDGNDLSRVAQAIVLKSGSDAA
eukprot:3515337-Amphidinium_carterae.1